MTLREQIQADTTLAIPALTELLKAKIDGDSALRARVAARKAETAAASQARWDKWATDARVDWDASPTTLPRLAAFAGIASMGTVFTAFSAFTPAATSAALYYMLHSTLATAAIFLIADLVTDRRGNATLTAQPRIAQQGLIAALFFANAIALAGMPPLSGFLGKLMVMDALRADAALIWSVILVSSFLMVLGFGRAGSTLFWKSHATGEPADPGRRPEPLAFAAIGGLIAGLVLLALFVTAIGLLLAALVYFLRDINQALRALGLEVRRCLPDA